MTRKREPVAEVGAEDYRIVRHTHDVELARALMRAKLLEENGCPGDSMSFCQPGEEERCSHPFALGQPRQVFMRRVYCLPNSYGAWEGWGFQYHDADGPGRGAFPAVVFS